MSDEIERKFWVDEIPETVSYLIDNATHFETEEYTQFYTKVTEDSEERYRKKVEEEGDPTFEYTEKRGGGLTREEVEEEIAVDEYVDALDEEIGRVEKTRHKIPYDGNTIELDVYHGDLEGLMTAEIEYSSKEEAEEAKLPEWLGLELTDDPRMKNKWLATAGLPKSVEKRIEGGDSDVRSKFG